MAAQEVFICPEESQPILSLSAGHDNPAEDEVTATIELGTDVNVEDDECNNTMVQEHKSSGQEEFEQVIGSQGFGNLSSASADTFSEIDEFGNGALLLEEQPAQRACWDDTLDHSQHLELARGDLKTPKVPVDDFRVDRISPANMEEGNKGLDREERHGQELEEDDTGEEEDDIALLISRELSEDSLEELASRFEEPSRLSDATPTKPDSRDEYADETAENDGEETGMLLLTMPAKSHRKVTRDKLAMAEGDLKTPRESGKTRAVLQETEVNTL